MIATIVYICYLFNSDLSVCFLVNCVMVVSVDGDEAMSQRYLLPETITSAA